MIWSVLFNIGFTDDIDQLVDLEIVTLNDLIDKRALLGTTEIPRRPSLS